MSGDAALQDVGQALFLSPDDEEEARSLNDLTEPHDLRLVQWLRVKTVKLQPNRKM